MKEYIKSTTKINELILQEKISIDEINRFSKSDYRWANNVKTSLNGRKVRKGNIYQFEFGKNFVPEMSYEHRGLVIGINKKLLYVLPIFSYIEGKHLDIYDPETNPKGDFFLLKNNEFDFIKHDSVLKLNDLRSVSTNRILYSHNSGRMNIESKTYKIIEELVVQKYFYNFFHEYCIVSKQKEELEEEIKNKDDKINELEEEIKNKDDKINELEEKLRN
ncbi:MAG: hypothetical protein KH020_10675 [Clostridiales bacterium]|nr:hypothetical protein [Clostridiales bacterium]